MPLNSLGNLFSNLFLITPFKNLLVVFVFPGLNPILPLSLILGVFLVFSLVTVPHTRAIIALIPLPTKSTFLARVSFMRLPIPFLTTLIYCLLPSLIPWFHPLPFPFHFQLCLPQFICLSNPNYLIPQPLSCLLLH